MANSIIFIPADSSEILTDIQVLLTQLTYNEDGELEVSSNSIESKNTVMYLKEVVTELKINNAYLCNITGDKITHKDIDN